MAAETVVRIGEWAVSSDADHTLTSIGLGSCIGLALVDRGKSVAGLAHVMLPKWHDGAADAPQAKFGDRAVPFLVDRIVAAGASKIRLEAILVGGAQMFSFSGASGMDIGARNAESVQAALGAQRIPVRATETGGSKGRTIRVQVGPSRVTYKLAGGVETELFPA